MRMMTSKTMVASKAYLLRDASVLEHVSYKRAGRCRSGTQPMPHSRNKNTWFLARHIVREEVGRVESKKLMD